MRGAVPDLPELARAVYTLTSELPWYHTLTRPFRGHRVQRAAERYVQIVYALELRDFREVEDFELVHRWNEVVIATLRRYVVSKYGPTDTVECAVFQDIIERLKIASEGIRAGLPPDPAKRPPVHETRALAERRLADTLDELGLSAPYRSEAGVR